MPFYNPFVQDEDELLAQDPTTAANMPPPVATPPPQDNNQAVPPQMMPPDYLKQESIFDNPDFQALQQIVNRKPTPEEQSRRAAEDSDMRTRSMFSNLAAIATGGRPTPSTELDKLIYDKRRQQDDDKISKYKTLLDMYGNVQTAQNNSAQKRITTLNTYLDTVPGSPKAVQNVDNFKNGIEHYKSIAKQNASMVGMSPEELQSQLDNLDKYNLNAEKMSYAQQEKLIAELDKKTNQGIGAARNMSTVKAGNEKALYDMEKDKRNFELQKSLANNTIANTNFDNNLSANKLAWEMEKDKNKANKIKLSHDQNKLMGEIGDTEFKITKADSLIDTLNKFQQDPNMKGQLSGWFTGGIKNPIKSMFNQTTNDKISDFGADLTRLFSAERKTFAGSSVTPAEMANLAPMIPDLKKDSEEAIIQKLKAAKRWLAEKQVKNYQQMQFDAEGNPVDQSLIAQRAKSAAYDMANSDEFLKKYYPHHFKNGSSSKPTVGKDSKIQDYANQHFNGNYEQAKSLLIKRGYKPNEQ